MVEQICPIQFNSLQEGGGGEREKEQTWSPIKLKNLSKRTHIDILVHKHRFELHKCSSFFIHLSFDLKNQAPRKPNDRRDALLRLCTTLFLCLVGKSEAKYAN